VPPQVTLWHSVWFTESHGYVVPALHVPLARLGPQFWQTLPVVRLFDPQVSAQAPAEVKQPEPALHPATQHWLPPPTAQVVCAAEHEHVLHVSPVPEQ